MRAIWKGTLSFGLINISVNIYSATEDHSLSFDMLHKTDLSPIRFARICKADGKEIPYKDIVKGYLNENDEYIVLLDEDFKRANVKKTKSIEIIDFVDEREIDPIFYEKPYYLEPGKGAEKAYVLLREALKKSKKVAIARFVFHNREHIAAIKPYNNVIVLDQLRYAAEIRKPAELNIPDEVEASQREVTMALKLIEQLTGHFNPKAYHDTYVEELKQIIAEKEKGIKPRARGKEPKASEVKDIMHLLEQSLATHQPKAAKPNAKKSARMKPMARSSATRQRARAQ